MMPIPFRNALALLGVALLAGGSAAIQAGDNCGCESQVCTSCCAPRHCCHHHRCRGCCHHHGDRRDLESRAAPVGPIVESVPMMRMMPIMAAPMMMASYVPQAAERAMPREEPSCQASSSRIDQLDQRFSALERRVDTLQSTLENQTAILQAIKTKLDGR